MDEFIRLEKLENGKELFDECVQKIEERIRNKEKMEAYIYDECQLYIEQYDRTGVWRVFRLLKERPYVWLEYNADLFAFACEDAIELWNYPDSNMVYETLRSWREEFDAGQKDR